MSAWIGLLAAIGAAGQAGDGLATRRAFECDIRDKRVAIVADSLGLRYTFGRSGRPPEIDLTKEAGSADVGYRDALFPRAERRHLRVSQGRVSYVAFQRFAAPDWRGRGAEDQLGLMVIRDGRRIALLRCTGGDGFGDYDFDWLRRDDADLTALATAPPVRGRRTTE